MKALICLVALGIGAYFAWGYYKQQDAAKSAPPPPPPQATPPAAQPAQEPEKKEEAKAPEPAPKDDAKDNAKIMEELRVELASKKDEWKKLKDEQKKLAEVLDEAKGNGFSNVNLIPERRDECKSALSRLTEARQKLADASKKVAACESQLRRTSSGTNSSFKAKSEMKGWRYTDEPASVCRPIGTLSERDKHKSIKYIEGDAISNKQSSEISQSQAELNNANAALASVKTQAEAAEKDVKAAGERYESEIKSKIADCKAKAKAMRDSGKALEEKLASLSGEKTDDAKADDEG